MLLFVILPVAATIIGVFFTSCGHTGPKPVLVPAAMILTLPAIVHYGRDFIRGGALKETGGKWWIGTRALGRPAPCGLRIWEPPKSMWEYRYIPTVEMMRELSGESTAQEMEVTGPETPWRGTRTGLVTTLTKAFGMVTRTSSVATTTTTVTATAVLRPTRTLIDIICKLSDRRIKGLALAVVRFAMLWCVRVIYWVIGVLAATTMQDAIEYFLHWLGHVIGLPLCFCRSAPDLQLFGIQVLYTFAPFFIGCQLAILYARQVGDAVIVETLMPYLMEVGKWVFWAYTWVEMCFFLQGLSLATLSHWAPQALESCQPRWALKTNAHFGVCVGMGQTCFRSGALRYPLVAGYTSWCIYTMGGLVKSPMYGVWSWIWHPGYEGVWALDLVKCLFPLT